MNYDEALGWLFSARHRGMKLGLANMQHLLERLGHPENRFRSIHVAGTNGKGSVCAFAEAALRTAGHRTGLFTSPHLLSFRERIQINRSPIEKKAMISGLDRVREAARDAGLEPTFFEITTALGFLHFAEEGAEIAVIETGLGGRLDSTNVLNPEVSVITSIGMDHMQWLGHTIEKIAAEKAGIFKRGRPAVSAPQDARVAEVLARAAASLDVDLQFVSRPWAGAESGPKGPHQRVNAAVADAALAAAGIAIGVDVRAAAYAGVKWPGRFDEVEPGLVLDGAHNPEAADALVAAWNERFPGEPASVIAAMVADKDHHAFFQRLIGIAREFHFVPLATGRGCDPADLAARVVLMAPEIPCVVCGSLGAIDWRRLPRPVLVTGSLYLVGDMMAQLGLGESDGLHNEWLTAPTGP